jgi:hypothetical protein
MTSETPTVYAATPADVRGAVLEARRRGLRVAVRATGHGTIAEPSPDTLLIDTSGMRSVLVDPDRRTARVNPGTTWGDVIEAAAPFGLAPVSGTDATVGVTGFTFGGGQTARLRRRPGDLRGLPGGRHRRHPRVQLESRAGAAAGSPRHPRRDLAGAVRATTGRCRRALRGAAVG